jgi:hypothetical protein
MVYWRVMKAVVISDKNILNHLSWLLFWKVNVLIHLHKAARLPEFLSGYSLPIYIPTLNKERYRHYEIYFETSVLQLCIHKQLQSFFAYARQVYGERFYFKSQYSSVTSLLLGGF